MPSLVIVVYGPCPGRVQAWYDTPSEEPSSARPVNQPWVLNHTGVVWRIAMTVINGGKHKGISVHSIDTFHRRPYETSENQRSGLEMPARTPRTTEQNLTPTVH